MTTVWGVASYKAPGTPGQVGGREETEARLFWLRTSINILGLICDVWCVIVEISILPREKGVTVSHVIISWQGDLISS